jgi:Zn-dependent protease with chaperone function
VIFAARGILVSLAFFATIYCLLSLAVVLAWRSINRSNKTLTASSTNFLFGLRISSFAVSVLVAVFFAFPSFWLMEKPSLDEDGGTFILAACSLLILGAGLFRALRAQAQTTSAVKKWSLESAELAELATQRHEMEISASVPRMTPALSASKGAPALILVGITRPNVMVSDRAAILLSDDELQVAVRHELGHKRSWDNLKKVLISATPFPGMRSLERAWREAAELAADDAAVTNRQDALDLASALIKLSRSSLSRPSMQSPEPALGSGLFSDSSSIRLRVKRLIEWRVSRARLQHIWPWTLLAVLKLIFPIAANYSATLVLTHRLTELLVP